MYITYYKSWNLHQKHYQNTRMDFAIFFFWACFFPEIYNNTNNTIIPAMTDNANVKDSSGITEHLKWKIGLFLENREEFSCSDRLTHSPQPIR